MLPLDVTGQEKLLAKALVIEVNVMIGANSAVLDDVEVNTVVMGTYAKTVMTNS